MTEREDPLNDIRAASKASESLASRPGCPNSYRATGSMASCAAASVFTVVDPAFPAIGAETHHGSTAWPCRPGLGTHVEQSRRSRPVPRIHPVGYPGS